MIFRLVELLLILVPLAGAIYPATKGVSAVNRRPGVSLPEVAAETAVRSEPKSQAAQRSTITRLLDQHSRTDARWLDYELDAGRLLDFPVMTDMREPLTVAFHCAKLRVDLLRPATAEDLLDDPEAARDYLDAVEAYATAFDAAESRGDPPAAPRLQPCRSAAADPGAEPAAGRRRQCCHTARTRTGL